MDIFDFSVPQVDERGHSTERNRYALTTLARWIPILGEGSPEGVVIAPQYSLYIDKNGSAGSIEYRKMQADIGGDTSQGWVAV